MSNKIPVQATVVSFTIEQTRARDHNIEYFRATLSSGHNWMCFPLQIADLRRLLSDAGIVEPEMNKEVLSTIQRLHYPLNFEYSILNMGTDRGVFGDIKLSKEQTSFPQDLD